MLDRLDVIIECLAQPLPDDHADVVHRARLIEAALVTYGHLPPRPEDWTPVDKARAVEAAAALLCDSSRHPRFTVDFAYQQLLPSTSGGLVQMALREAIKHTAQSEHEALRAAANRLLDAHREAREAEVS